jgi:DNA-binding IclR family transcriptional regulator
LTRFAAIPVAQGAADSDGASDAQRDTAAGDSAAPKLVGALVNGLRIVRHLSTTSTPLGVNRIARDLAINPSTCFALLRTLAHEGLVQFDPQTKSYTIALGLVELARGTLELASYVRFVKPHLETIAAQNQVTATLWQPAGKDRVVLVDLANHDAAVRVHMSIGQRLPMYVAALGRCMAAFSGLTKAELKRHFQSLRWENPPTFEQYWSDVGRVRLDGYSIDADHYVRGVTTVSVPVLDDAGRPLMAISAVGFSAQLDARRLKVLGQDLRAHAQRIARGLPR